MLILHSLGWLCNCCAWRFQLPLSWISVYYMRRLEMASLIRQISISFFCSIYLAVSLAGLIGTMQLPTISLGPKTVASAAAGTKEKPRVVWMPRRHIPLVKPFSIPTETTLTVEFRSGVQEHFFVTRYSHSDSYLSHCFSSVGGRAPPVA